MTGTLPKVKIADVPENRAVRIRGFGIVGKVQTREIANGFLQLAVPLYFLDGEVPPADQKTILENSSATVQEASEAGTLEGVLSSLGLRTFTARWNVRPEWFDAGYTDLIRSGQVSENEHIQYNINMSGLTRGLAKSAGLDEVDFEAVTGKVVGFTTKNRKDDPSRLDIAGFYSPFTKKPKAA